jgi:hypothetical protein
MLNLDLGIQAWRSSVSNDNSFKRYATVCVVKAHDAISGEQRPLLASRMLALCLRSAYLFSMRHRHRLHPLSQACNDWETRSLAYEPARIGR